MRDLCMRSACLGAADALVVMDVRDLTFTVCDLDEVDGPGSAVLCETHLDRLRAPNGWTVVDVRTRGNLIPLPERSRDPEESDDQMLRPVADVEPIRPVAAAVHPLESARDTESRPESSPAPEAAETPLLARAFLGVDRHPAVADDQSELKADPFEDHQWDQRDQPEDQEDGQLTFGGEPVA